MCQADHPTFAGAAILDAGVAPTWCPCMLDRGHDGDHKCGHGFTWPYGEGRMRRAQRVEDERFDPGCLLILLGTLMCWIGIGLLLWWAIR